MVVVQAATGTGVSVKVRVGGRGRLGTAVGPDRQTDRQSRLASERPDKTRD